MQSPAPGIHLQRAGLTLSGKRVLAPLTLAMTEARIAIIGRNGSGKTSLLRLIAGLVAPNAGSVRLEGFDPATDRKAAVAAVGILFQNPDHQIIFPTVEQELAFGLRQQGQTDAGARAEARALLTAHGRTHWAEAPVTNLSHGQRQFLCLLSILIMRPATILLDEPFAGLDLPTQIRMTRLIAGLPQRVITVTHAPALLPQQDRILWLEAGALRADGTPEAVLPAFAAEMARLGDGDADADLAG